MQMQDSNLSFLFYILKQNILEIEIRKKTTGEYLELVWLVMYVVEAVRYITLSLARLARYLVTVQSR